MKKISILLIACFLMFSMTNCGQSSSNDVRIAELKDSIEKLNRKISSQDASLQSQASSVTMSQRHNNEQSIFIVGTYEITDNRNTTWVLVVESDEDESDEGNAYMYDKSKGQNIIYYGSWYKYSHMKYARFSFSDGAPGVFFPSDGMRTRYPCIDSKWFYYNSSAADAKNPELRLPIKKIK